MLLLKKLWVRLLDPRTLQVYHHDSPGIRVFVRRNRFQRLYLDRFFSNPRERHLTLAEAFPEHVGSPRLLAASAAVVGEFNRALVGKGNK